MIFSLNENRKLTIKWNVFYEGLVMFDQEMKVFYKAKQMKEKTPERKLHLVCDKIL